MRTLALVLFFAALAGAQEKVEDPADCELLLRNGSRVRGVLRSPTEVVVKSKNDEKRFSLADVWSVRWGNVKAEEFDVVMTRNGAVEGWIGEMEPFVIDTGFGEMKVPPAEIRSMRRFGKGAFTWTFEKDTLAGWTKVGATAWAVSEGKLAATPAGTGHFLRLDDTIDSPFTIELEIACDDWAAVAWHAEDPAKMTAFWIYPGQAGVYGRGNWTNTAIASWKALTQAGKSVKVKLELDGKRVQAWVDGTLLGEAPAHFESGQIALAAWQKAATFDELKITR